MTVDKKRYMLLAIGGTIGLAAAFLQTIEKLLLVGNKNANLPCNINDVFSCSTVLNAPQSSLFGFPNSLLCLVIFTVFVTVGVLGLSGSRILNRARYMVQALAVFMLLFALWFLFTSTFVIGAICIFCIFCFGGLLLINGALWRLNFSTNISKSRFQDYMYMLTDRSLDILIWITLAVILAAAVIVKFYIA